MEYAVCGIGVNICPPEGGFPEEIKDIAGGVFDAPSAGDVKNRIAAGIIEKFMEYYANLPEHSFFEEYVRRSVIVGKEIVVLGKDKPRKATALSINQNCNLTVRYDDGTEETLSSGEVSIKI